MTLKQASRVLDVSKKRLWRAVKSGQLEAEKVERGGRWEYRVTQQQLEGYRRKYLDSLEMRAVGWTEPPPEAAESSVLLEREQQLARRLQDANERARRLEKQIVKLREELEEREKVVGLATERLREAHRTLADLL